MRKDIAVVIMDAATIAAINLLISAQKAGIGSIKLPTPAFYNFKTCPASLGAGFASALADKILMQIPAHPCGAFISVGDWTPTSKLTTYRGGSLRRLR